MSILITALFVYLSYGKKSKGMDKENALSLQICIYRSLLCEIIKNNIYVNMSLICGIIKNKIKSKVLKTEKW